MSGAPAEQDETTDYRTTRQGTGQRAKDGIRHRDTETTAQDKAEGKALRECVLQDLPIKEERSPHLWRSDRSNLVAD